MPPLRTRNAPKPINRDRVLAATHAALARFGRPAWGALYNDLRRVHVVEVFEHSSVGKPDAVYRVDDLV